LAYPSVEALEMRKEIDQVLSGQRQQIDAAGKSGEAGRRPGT
jgi:hypothetical protein